MRKQFATRLALAAMTIATTAVVSGSALAQMGQDKSSSGASGQSATMSQQGMPDQKQMMDMMAQMGAPGDHHKMLASFVGTWDAKMSSWMMPGQPPMESSGTSTMTMILGGRYLQEQFTGSFNGQPFHGIGYTGYDNAMKKYVGTWMDDMGTAIMEMQGDLDASGKVMNYTSEMADPMSGTMQTTREVMTVTDNDHHMFQMFAAGPDGKDMKIMEINYTRKM